MIREIRIRSEAYGAVVTVEGDLPEGVVREMTHAVRNVALDYMGVEVEIDTIDIITLDEDDKAGADQGRPDEGP